jgi:hypothetical protein
LPREKRRDAPGLNVRVPGADSVLYCRKAPRFWRFLFSPKMDLERREIVLSYARSSEKTIPKSGNRKSPARAAARAGKLGAERRLAARAANWSLERPIGHSSGQVPFRCKGAREERDAEGRWFDPRRRRVFLPSSKMTAAVWQFRRRIPRRS